MSMKTADSIDFKVCIHQKKKKKKKKERKSTFNLFDWEKHIYLSYY